MNIQYDANGKSKSGGTIHGNVIINSQNNISNLSLRYSIVSCHFTCNGKTCGSASGTAGEISIPLGQLQDSVVPGNGVWRLGNWSSLTGALFNHVDSSAYQTKLSEYQSLPPVVDLCCDNADINSTGPFIPTGHLILTWNPRIIAVPPTNLHVNE